MAERNPLTWQPHEVVEVTNVSDENLLLELRSGPFRLDVGRSYRVTASALEQPPIRALLERGLIKATAVKA